MESLNRRICALGLDNTVTMCVIFLDPSRGSAIVVNAGHMPPLLKRADGSIEEPGQEESGWPLGTEEEASYQGARIDLKPGDFLLMYTDGVFEAFGEDNTQFSIDRVRKMVAGHQGDLDGLMESIVQSVVAHIGSGKQEDDMCMVAIGCR
jgi:serine phosphatase RsbU (regulator of sigma subunit)